MVKINTLIREQRRGGREGSSRDVECTRSLRNSCSFTMFTLASCV